MSSELQRQSKQRPKRAYMHLNLAKCGSWTCDRWWGKQAIRARSGKQNRTPAGKKQHYRAAGGRGRLWSGSEYSPDTSEIFIWIMCRFTPQWTVICAVGGKMIRFNFHHCWDGGGERKERQGNESERERKIEGERNKELDMRWGRQMEVYRVT